MTLAKLPQYLRASTQPGDAIGVVMLGSDGADPGVTGYVLAKAVAIGAGTGTAPVGSIRRDTYIWDAQFTGAGPLKLQGLAADGVTWRDIVTLANPGTLQGEIRIGANATMRLFSDNGLTAVSSVLS